jgi:hypothetical protein
LGSTMGFFGVDHLGNPVTVVNKMTNVGWEYVWHCHLLGHEENDMMRPFVVHPLLPVAATNVPGATVSSPALAWNSTANNLQMIVRAADSTIWKATFDSSGVFNNDWANVPGRAASAPALAWNFVRE